MSTPLSKNVKGLEVNMYDCTACPKCGSTYRAPFRRPDGLICECDDCGHREPWTAANGRPEEEAQ